MSDKNAVQRLRDEIRDTERAIRARGGSDFTANDLDNMQYLHAVIKVYFIIASRKEHA